MWDLPGPGLEPMSPALAGGFLTTVPPGKPSTDLQQRHQDNSIGSGQFFLQMVLEQPKSYWVKYNES